MEGEGKCHPVNGLVVMPTSDVISSRFDNIRVSELVVYVLDFLSARVGTYTFPPIW